MKHLIAVALALLATSCSSMLLEGTVSSDVGNLEFRLEK